MAMRSVHAALVLTAFWQSAAASGGLRGGQRKQQQQQASSQLLPQASHYDHVYDNQLKMLTSGQAPNVTLPPKQQHSQPIMHHDTHVAYPTVHANKMRMHERVKQDRQDAKNAKSNRKAAAVTLKVRKSRKNKTEKQSKQKKNTQGRLQKKTTKPGLFRLLSASASNFFARNEAPQNRK